MERKNGAATSMFAMYTGKFIKKALSVTKCLVFSISVSWKASRKHFLLRVAFEALGTAVPVAVAFLGRDVINLLVDTVQKGSINEGMYRFMQLLTIILLVQFFNSVFQRFNNICADIHKDKVSNFLNMQVLKKISELDISFFDSPKFYDEITNARRDSQFLQSLAWISINIISAAMQLFVAIPILWRLHWVLPLVLIVSRVPAILVEKNYTRYTYAWTRERAPVERKMAYLQGIAMGRAYAKDVKLFGIFNEMLDRYTVLWNQWFNERKSILLQRGKWAALCSALPQAVTAAITFFIGVQILYRRLTIGDYSFYTGISGQISNGLNSLITAITNIYDSELRITNYMKFLEWKSNLAEGGTLLPSAHPEIEFKDVSFIYPGTERYVLKNLSFHIRPGEKIALVGVNGSGKSTIVKLMLRFYDVTEGQVLVNGVDIREYDLNGLRKLFTAVFQDYANYAFTVRENVTLSDFESEKDEVRVREACSMSGVDRILPKWKKGLDSFLTKQFEEDGEELSGGEWQKIAIARAFFRKNSSVIILDEPTSALDPESEHSMFLRFSELCEGRTAFFISHKLSSVTMADRILVLEGGRIVEEGSYAALMDKGGKFAYLFNLQAEKYIRKGSA